MTRGGTRAASLSGLAIAGHAAALSLIDAPPYAVFQHYGEWSALAHGGALLSLGVLMLQACVCVWCACRQWSRLRDGALRLAPTWQLALVLCISGFALAIPTVSVGRFAGELVLAALVTSVSASNLVLAALEIPEDTLRRWVDPIDARLTLFSRSTAPRPWDRALPWCAALWVLGVGSVIAVFVFERLPHVDEDIIYLFQAKTLAAGRLWLPQPVETDAFAMTHLIADGERWYGKFFPGWPAVLAIGVLGGAPWLVNPVLGALSVLCAHSLAQRIYGRRTANVATLLLVVSPWFLFLSGSLMGHSVSLLCMLIALLAIELQRARRMGGWSLVAGVALGAMFVNRPFDAALFGPIAGLWAIGVTRQRLSLGSLVCIASCAALVSSTMLAYDAALTGSAWVAPHRLWAETLFGRGVDVFGFGPNVGIPLWRNVDPLPGHGIADAVLNLNKNLHLIQFELFGWACGSLVFAATFLVSGRYEKADFVAVAVVGAIVVGHAFYWAQGGPDFGARYWYLLSFPLVLLSVRGMALACARWSTRGVLESAVVPRVAAVVVLASLSAVLTMIPWRAVGKYHGYRGIRSTVRDLAAAEGIADALVFVRSSRKSDYQMAFSENPVPLDGRGNVYARDLGPAKRAAVIQAFPNRPIWVIGPANLEQPTLAILDGPLPPSSSPQGDAPKSPAPLQATVRAARGKPLAPAAQGMAPRGSGVP